MVKPKRLLRLLLRIIVLGSTLAAVIIMATSHEKGTFFALSYEAKYSDTPAFKFFVIANSIVTVYGFLVLFIPSESQLWGLVLALDLVITQHAALICFINLIASVHIELQNKYYRDFRHSREQEIFPDFTHKYSSFFNQLFTMLLISSISAALAVAQVGKKGNSRAGWLPVCGQVTKYCNQVTGALVAGFIAIITYIILLLYSIYTFLNPLLGKNG